MEAWLTEHLTAILRLHIAPCLTIQSVDEITDEHDSCTILVKNKF